MSILLNKNLKIITILILLAGQVETTQALPDFSFDKSFREDTTRIKDSFVVECADFSSLPLVFQNGYILLYQRVKPGVIFLLDVKGNVVWSFQSSSVGFKVVSFTKYKTLLCITGTKDKEAGYGNGILELSLDQDTILCLNEEQKNFLQTAHHEILLNSKNQIVILCREERIFDLSPRRGAAQDTVIGDGILVLDRQGHTIWKWTVFDEMDPRSDDKILLTKKDWMHANSLTIDNDGNYLIAFYNNGQIWKVNAKNGKVVWKFGRNGDFEIPANALFDQAHSLHVTKEGWLMFFDNGTNKKNSRTLAFSLNEHLKKAQPVINSSLPSSLFVSRMGSSYLVNDTSLLVCVSLQKTVALTDLHGHFLWQLKSNRIESYRAEFIPGEVLTPLLENFSCRAKSK